MVLLRQEHKPILKNLLIIGKFSIHTINFKLISGQKFRIRIQYTSIYDMMSLVDKKAEYEECFG